MSAEAEPRRSVRATKGQHTKSFDELEPAAAPKRRQTKKTKKAKEQEAEQEQEQEQQQEREQEPEPEQEQEEDQEEEIIRCVCGATEQDEDSGEAWIACETCGAWQHNVCVGVSSYDDEIPEHYWCEQCRPENHKELLDGIAKGEKPWEARRKAHEEESEKKKRRGGRRGKGKRNSDPKEELEKSTATKPKPSPAPDAGKEKKEPAPKPGKRKSREDSHDVEGKTSKMRRVSENEAVPVPVPVPVRYTPPPDLAKTVTELPNARMGPAKALIKSLGHVLGSMQKQGDIELDEGSSVESMSETYALQIERAVFDSHPATKGQKEYNQQIKTLSFNLKNNPELCSSLVGGTISPPSLAVMTSEQLASSEMQKQTAEMKAKAEKQSILYTSETGPRVRRTHKGEEVIEDESFVNNDAPPLPAAPRRSATVKNEPSGGDQVDLASHPAQHEAGQHSPSNPNFDITKVFSSVKSPTGTHNRRPSAPVSLSTGPGVDADVDRMLQEENESPPYSPTEETQDPDVIWRGSLAMSSIANFPATAKHIGGANFAAVGSWSKLIPKRMTVAGRITQQSATEYLCSLRYSSVTDIIVINLTPVAPAAHAEFNALIEYFVSKKRYGVVGDKVVGNVRDTYLVPVSAGDDNYPEFMLNLVDNKIPKTRTEPMLLAVFVYRNDPEHLNQLKDSTTTQPETNSPQTPTPTGYGKRSNSMASVSGPSFSPATPQAPQGAFPPPQQPFHGHLQSTTPVPIPQPPHTRPQAAVPVVAAPPVPPVPTVTPGQMSEAQKYSAQQAGQAMAQEVLGPLVNAPTVQFLIPQAYQMSRNEWEVIKRIFVRDPRAKEDLQHLGVLLEKEGALQKAAEAAQAQ
ncbi:transcription factor S-II, central domain-containing protein [Dactylonectria estremocensis]|uniref:Transcription factor BYE1 n=1 Tax=Dactylonectria estremocensis TaxID=1079267 RepID=A0A9P9IRP7_9HYPO|nr:transcription factor S-II, central domain-containing protein [Dactylonectria estremocensis]